jgi:acyl-CoA synthetase (AMP-forming)/AMP-acid ligase II
VVLADTHADPAAILAEANAHLGKTQRISAIEVVDELPRSAIGKVLKRDLRDRFGGNPVTQAFS